MTIFLYFTSRLSTSLNNIQHIIVGCRIACKGSKWTESLWYIKISILLWFIFSHVTSYIFITNSTICWTAFGSGSKVLIVKMSGHFLHDNLAKHDWHRFHGSNLKWWNDKSAFGKGWLNQLKLIREASARSR